MFGPLVIGGVLLSGCGIDKEPKAIAQAQEAENVSQDEALKEVTKVEVAETKQVISEYLSLEDFIQDTWNNWQPESEYRNHTQNAATDTLTNATNIYVGYFHNEITEAGMIEEFERLSVAASKFTNGVEDEKNPELMGEYTEALRDIVEKLGA
ncbi:hypothetical protein [Sporosarcina sp. ITBMC105]